MVQPEWTHIVGSQEFRVKRKRFPWARTTPSGWRACCRCSGAPGENEFARAENCSILSDRSVGIQTHEGREHPQQEQNSRPHPEPLSLHCPRASRARCKLRSLFISTSSRNTPAALARQLLLPASLPP